MFLYKNTASQKIAIYAFDTSANTAKTGDALNITGYISKDCGVSAQTNDVNPTELDATNCAGLYFFDLTQAETNADLFILSAKSSTSGISIEPVTAYTALLTPTRAGYIDNLSAGAVALETTSQDIKTEVLTHPTLTEIEATTVLAKEATLTTIAGYIDTEVTTIVNALSALQTDIGDPSVDVTTIYAQVLLVKGYVDELETRLTATRAGYLDNLSGGAIALNSTVAKEATVAAINGAVGKNKTLLQILVSNE